MKSDFCVKSVLAVDDDDAILRVVTRVLGALQVKVYCARSREEALDGLAAAPEAVLLDLILGPENGWDVLRELRERTEAPIVMVTGGSIDREVARDAEALGADGVLAKPFTNAELFEAISRAVVRRRAKDAPRS